MNRRRGRETRAELWGGVGRPAPNCGAGSGDPRRTVGRGRETRAERGTGSGDPRRTAGRGRETRAKRGTGSGDPRRTLGRGRETRAERGAGQNTRVSARHCSGV